jgi:hypothetical protein
MTYVLASEFRAASAKHWTSGIRLENADISDPDLTALIASASGAFDRYTGDHFEPETGSAISVTVNTGTDTFTATAHGLANGWTVQVAGASLPAPLVAATNYFVVGVTANTFQLALTSGGAAIDITTTGTTVTVTSYTTTVTADGEDNPWLWMPKRVRAVVSITVRYPGGAVVSVPSTSYTYESFTGDYSQIAHGSKVSIISGLYVWPTGWPGDVQNVAVTGSFGWPTTPDEVRRAVSLMVWDVVKPQGDILGRSEPTGYTNPQSLPTGIPDTDNVIAFFCRRVFA